MSLKAQLEILVHLESFRNINIYHQGVYVLRCYIQQKINGEQKLDSYPYNIVKIDQQKVRQKMVQKYKQDSSLYDIYFYSKAFVIKYMDEIVDLDDICHFRAEIDAFPVYNEDNFYFFIDLLHLELSQLTTDQSLSNDDDYKDFKVVGKFESKLHNSFQGIREFIPVHFTDIYYSQLNVTIHTALIGYKFRINNSKLQVVQDKQLTKAS
ncbi:serine esterase, putative [Ichthyophthirius multifiliis]|uniref:Serine esterase, putative n=1 Tax=Ichthyophthirius multifiliis TaxID=5932 RepID=G0QND4_ICHMU|nr:serine esterase, putative [Ichthyophthirius multifiliis]EGR33267.1 serine esterase, putative [Ichthyophthirius multifiliis]|eukprot:XP_004037253.1 serine esterase, putative [Ichthyophthirius multifiliis]